MDTISALERLDPWGEWRNPHDHPEVAAYLVEHQPDYAQSVGFIRAMRPREDPHEAALWWASPEAKAHFVNAILQRGNRPLMAVEREMGLAKWKLHHYLDHFNFVIWMRPRRGTHIILPSGNKVEGVIREVLEGVPVQAVVECEEGWWLSEWSRSSWAFRAKAPTAPPGSGWRRLVRRRPLLLVYAPEIVGLYLGSEGYSRLWKVGGSGAA
jgi:hypothetical protein